MKVLLSWLKEYVDAPYSVEELVERLPMLGIGVDGTERMREDAVFDLEVAANRGDLMSHLGIARELAAAGRSAVRPPAADVRSDRAGAAGSARVDVREPELCPRFTAALIVDARVGPSPGWLVRRLEACGLRSINNVVDVTNYVMLELGQPMHAFDYDLLQEGRLIVRRAAPGERLTTLDGVERVLDPQTLVVADAGRAAGIAGIIGGAASEIRPATRRVLLEAASWHPPMIRRTGTRLGVRTESSARFERGIDTGAVREASLRAQHLLVEVTGGRVVGDMLDAYPAPQPPRQVDLRWSSVARLLGIEVPRAEGAAILRSLGFGLTDRRDAVAVVVPSFRRDVEREEDLIEEIARHHGYEHIPETMPVERTSQGMRASGLEAEHAVRETLIRAGLTEALTVSLTKPAALDGLRLPADHPWRQMAGLRNPMVEDHTHLRTSLLPGLLQVARVNISRTVADLHFFELGRTFHPTATGVAERRRLAILMTGALLRGAWNVPQEAAVASYFHLKGVVESLLAELRIPGAVYAPDTAAWLHPGRAARLSVGSETVGTLGELHPDVAASHDLPPGVFVADLDLELVLARAVFRPRFAPLPRYPAVRRDIAAVLPDEIPAAQVETVISEAGGAMLESADLFDVYVGAPVPAGHRNLAYALLFRSAERTLSSDEVEESVAAIKAALTQRLRARIRE